MNINLAASAVATSLVQRGEERANDVALVTPTESTTFEEIAWRTANLATSIVEQNPPSYWLPVFVDRSVDAVIAILASLHAGRPLAPIDATLPTSRIEQLMSRLGNPTHALVSRPEMASALPANVQAISGQRLHTTFAEPVLVAHDSPGSVLFTSGSTGRAKGVVRNWKAIDRRLGDVVPHGQSIRSSHLQPMNFSGGISKAVRLAAGETLYVADPRSLPLDELIRWLATHEITVARLGGGIVDALLRRPDLNRRLPSVREISVFGSRRDWSQIPLIRTLCSPDVIAVNSYASTETGNVSRFEIGSDQEIGSGRIPSGTLPIDRLKLVECEDGQEIWVRDPDALEYLGDPELTAQRFITDEAGVRWWRSGDLGRVDDEGNFYFTGRRDLMIKINGMRIEPEESEHALKSLRGVSDAAVVAHPTSNGSHRLVGHICVEDDGLSPDDVNSHLRSLLPSHLVPAILVRHDSLPRTDRQKLDRPALLSTPLQRWARPVPDEEFSPQARWLASKVEQVIGLGRVAPNEDMWGAGLDSVGAVELCSMIAAEGWGHVDPRLLLTSRTAQRLEVHIGRRRRADPSHVVVFNDGGALTPIFAIPGTSGTAFAYRSLAETLGPNQPIVVIEPRGMHTKGRIDWTIEARASSVVDEVNRRLGENQPCLLISHSGGATIAFESARRLIDSDRNPHLLFLDGIPRDSASKDPTSEWSKRLHAERRRFSSSSSSLKWLGSFLRRAPNKVWLLAMRPVLVRFPGKRRYSIDHYKNFWWIDGRAMKKYTLRPLAASATLLHVGKASLPEQCAPWVSSLESYAVGGEHNSMLYPPHVREIATHVERLCTAMTTANL